MSALGDAENTAGPDGQPPQSALPEGAQAESADPALGEGVPPFRGQAEPSNNLSLLADLDEPVLLARSLQNFAGERTINQNWATIHAGLVDINRRLGALQAPGAR
jgi:hypothetical protein